MSLSSARQWQSMSQQQDLTRVGVCVVKIIGGDTTDQSQRQRGPIWEFTVWETAHNASCLIQLICGPSHPMSNIHCNIYTGSGETLWGGDVVMAER